VHFPVQCTTAVGGGRPLASLPVNGRVSQPRSHTHLVDMCEHSWRYLFRCRPYCNHAHCQWRHFRFRSSRSRAFGINIGFRHKSFVSCTDRRRYKNIYM